MRLSVATLLALCFVAGCGQPPVKWRAIEDPGEAMLGHMNTHATALAWVVRHYGWDDEEWPDKRLVAAMNLYAVEDCDGCPVPSIWHLDQGLRDYLEANQVEGVEVEEGVRLPTDRPDAVSFADYAAEIDAGRPVIVTLCYDPATADSPDYATQRALHATSMVGIGYAEVRGEGYLICHDGFEEAPGRRKVIDDWRGGQEAGADSSGPWRQEGTSLYPWDGEHANVVMVFVRPATE
ncbi:MAG: hypothetical protein GF393_07890 [Armatimonadia bacterium]|nr:hypothetical protein [Armatimonadia bacterium]